MDIPDEQPDEVPNLLGVVLPEAGDGLPNLGDLSERRNRREQQTTYKNGLSMDESIDQRSPCGCGCRVSHLQGVHRELQLLQPPEQLEQRRLRLR